VLYYKISKVIRYGPCVTMGSHHRSVYFPDAVPPIHVVSYHVATDKLPPPKMSASSGLF